MEKAILLLFNEPEELNLIKFECGLHKRTYCARGFKRRLTKKSKQ